LISEWSYLHFTSLHFTSHHRTPHYSLTTTFGRSSPPFKNPSLLTYNHFPNSLSKIMWFTAESRWRLCRQSVPQFDCPIYKAVFTVVCSLVPDPNFTIVIIPAQVAWSL